MRSYFLASSAFFATNIFFCLLLSLLIGNVWASHSIFIITISHHLQKSLDAGMESYIVQLDFSAAFDRVRHNGLLFKLESIGIGAVCCPFIEFLSDRGG